jgi:phage FluMu protein gp41
MSTQDLMTLHLVDGIPATVEGREIRYRVARLREINVNDERRATRMAERVMLVAGQPKLMVSEADKHYAMTMLHIDALECDGQRMSGALLDLELFGKLTSHDLGLLEQRVFLLNMAAELRYGNITQAQFDALLGGEVPAALKGPAPQPVGQVAGAGPAGPGLEPGPALLADYAGGAAGGAPGGHGRAAEEAGTAAAGRPVA